MRALVLQHHESAPAGHLAGWARARGIGLDVHTPQAGPPPDPRGFDLVVSLGSPCSVTDRTVAWIAPELRAIEAAVARDVPVLGICFGGQLLARALGARVAPAAEPQMGWHAVATERPELVEPGPWFYWHYDAFEVPAGAELVAATDVCPAAFRAGRCLGLHFHPEVEPDAALHWIDRFRGELDARGVDPERLRAEIARRRETARVAAWRLFDRFARDVAGLLAP